MERNVDDWMKVKCVSWRLTKILWIVAFYQKKKKKKLDNNQTVSVETKYVCTYDILIYLHVYARYIATCLKSGIIEL